MELIMLIAFSFCLVSVFGSPLPAHLELEESVDANDYIDGMIADIKSSDRFATVPLPEYRMINNFTIFGIELYSQEVVLKKGHTHDAQTIKRIGDAFIDYRKANFDVEVKFYFEQLRSHFDFTWLVYNIGPTGKLDVNLKDVYVTFRLFADLDLAQADLTEFRLTSTAPTDIKVHISWLIDWLLNPLIEKFYAKEVLPYTEATLKKLLNEYIDQVNGPNITNLVHRSELVY
ncbi:unnamed protein product [Bemisia tabaci]|uniref:Uncharacterized protein n=1 Tax=Bemisia tabaci TaxID=7038 RepID=A0A9P0AG63_BEMTA|nr:unnamed protein product [Bemisia tabaci]